MGCSNLSPIGILYVDSYGCVGTVGHVCELCGDCRAVEELLGLYADCLSCTTTAMTCGDP